MRLTLDTHHPLYGHTRVFIEEYARNINKPSVGNYLISIGLMDYLQPSEDPLVKVFKYSSIKRFEGDSFNITEIVDQLITEMIQSYKEQQASELN